MSKLALLFACLLYAVFSVSQSAIQKPTCTGVIEGTVFDPAGQPAKGVRVTAWPLGVGLGAMLPTIGTDELGHYRFQNVCPGRYTVIADDEKVAYTPSSPELNAFLYGTPAMEIRLTAKHTYGNLPVHLPPRPGFIHLRVINQETKEEVLQFSVQLEVPGQKESPEMSVLFNQQVHNHRVEIPPDKDVILHLTADGFHEWSESAGRGKLVRVASGIDTLVEVDLKPLP
ncbi:MAG: carboxypeptidase-like regulatory domain-containing protein [Terriglobales bacterium]|jgi:protocatechuate 3,4-dioxygenase beta subunit